MNSTPLFVCLPFAEMVFWLFFNFQRYHVTSPVGRAHIKHSITSIIIRLIVDLIFLIFF